MNRIVLLLTSVVVIFSSALHAQQANESISRTDNIALGEADYRSGLIALSEEERAQLRDNPTLLLKFALRLHSNRALALQAEEQGLDKDPRTQALIERARDNILMTAYMQKIIEDIERPDLSKLAKERYLATRESFRTDERRRVAHILLTDISVCPCEVTPPEEAIKEIKDELDSGADFETLAQENSHDLRTRLKGGEIAGWVSQNGEMPFELETAIFSLKKVGDISSPVKTKFGWHVIKLLEIDPSIIPPFSAVQARLERQLWAEIQTKAQEHARGVNYPIPDDINIEAINELLSDLNNDN